MRELARSDPVRPQDRWTYKLDALVWPRARGVFGRYGWLRREFDESKHPREPAGSSTGGQFAGGGGEQGELWPGKFPGKGKKKVNSVEDFRKEKIEVNSNKTEKFIEVWNDAVGLEPGEFHKDFTGGLPSTMTINHRYYEHDDGDVLQNQIKIDGNLLADDGSTIGTYTRVIDVKNNKAESSYFSLNEHVQGKGEGKQMLAANVKMYQELGLDKVTVHANIDVGGYAWAKYGYVPTQDSWNDLRESLLEKVDSGGGGGTIEPEEWDMMSGDNQDSVRNAWKESTHDEFYDSEVENWHESGQALEDAKTAVAEQFNAESQWANNAVDKWRSERPADAPPVLSNKRILDIVTVEYDGRHGDGRDDPTITIEDVEWLSEHDLNTLEAALIDSFNGRAQDKENEMDPPDSIEDNISELQNDSWDNMRDRDKFSYAQDNGLVENIEDESGGDGEPLDLNPTQETLVRKLLDEEDPKTIWALSDTAAGKQLLLGTDWEGAIDFHDKETMARFNSYVGKVKASAGQTAAAA